MGTPSPLRPGDFHVVIWLGWTSKCSASWAIVRSPLTAARATFALKAAEWFRRGRLLIVSPVHGDYRRCQAEIPLIVLFGFPGPALGKHTPWAIREFSPAVWYGHRDASVELALIPIYEILFDLQKHGKRPFYADADRSLIP